MAALLVLEIGLLTELYFYLIVKCNADHHLNLGWKTQLLIWTVSLAGGIGIALFMEHWGRMGQICCGVLASYLLTASITDFQTFEVYDFIAVFAGLTGMGMLLTGMRKDFILPLLLFLGIQFFLFMKFYGKADGYAFMVCAVYESRYGQGLLTYLFHMGSAFLLLGAVQGMRKNIDSRGNLRQSVAFLPYISLTVWWFL